jgi:hypothetical protein
VIGVRGINLRVIFAGQHVADRGRSRHWTQPRRNQVLASNPHCARHASARHGASSSSGTRSPAPRRFYATQSPWTTLREALSKAK